jgi:hypothetical protein
MFLSGEDTVENATALVLKHIRMSYADPSFVKRVETGLLKITFWTETSEEDGTANAPPINQGQDTNNKNDPVTQSSGSGLSLSSLLFVAMGSAALVITVGSVYYWKRRRGGGDDEDGGHGSSATRLASLTINDTATFENNDEHGEKSPPSPYSEMVSGSYRLDRLGEMSILSSSNMSPVYEMDGNETDTDTVAGATSVMISEGGYTTDAGGTDTEGDSTVLDNTSKYSSSQSTLNVLGARPFPGTVGNIDMEDVSDSDLDTSGEMSPVKMYIGHSLMNHSKLLVLPSGRDPMEEENEDESLLFRSPASKAGSLNLETAPTDEFLTSESVVGSMSRTSPMSQNTEPSLPSF